MEFLSGFEMPVVTGICLSIGYIIKNLIPGSSVDRLIPMIMGILGVGMSIWINLSFTPEILLSGLISGLASTGLYEVFHQFLKK